jgi:hypothetical protein
MAAGHIACVFDGCDVRPPGWDRRDEEGAIRTAAEGTSAVLLDLSNMKGCWRA